MSYGKTQTAESEAPGTNLASLLEAPDLESAFKLSHKMTRRMRLKFRIFTLAMAGRISPENANRALVLCRLVAA